MNPTLILFSGLPGCSKSTLARLLAHELRIPRFAKDRFQSRLRRQVFAGRETADGYQFLLDMADKQVSLGISVVLDAVFPLPGYRETAAHTARHYEVNFRPVVCICSDETEWRRRLAPRQHSYVPHWSPVGWSEVERLQDEYTEWEPESALVLDAVYELEDILKRVIDWIHDDRQME